MKKSDQQRILVIEDELHIAEGLKLNLSLQGCEVRIAPDGASGLQEWKEWRPDLIVLDIMLPGIDGLDVLQNIRLEDEHVSILILSARGDTEDRIKGLSYGVDDYLAKPFNLEEFLLRVERLLVRASRDRAPGDPREDGYSSLPVSYRFGHNQVAFDTGAAQCQAGDIRLTEQEIRLLKLFIVHKSKPLSREKILKIGWGYTGGMTTRTVDNFIVRFRKYFEENPKKPVFFKSIRSVGYMFDHEE
ncbi:MAG: response regulator transcription factor [Desulfobacterales bacterium]|nr:response regulator transcription factor [Desulfobacterales bacterium]